MAGPRFTRSQRTHDDAFEEDTQQCLEKSPRKKRKINAGRTPKPILPKESNPDTQTKTTAKKNKKSLSLDRAQFLCVDEAIREECRMRHLSYAIQADLEHSGASLQTCQSKKTEFEDELSELEDQPATLISLWRKHQLGKRIALLAEKILTIHVFRQQLLLGQRQLGEILAGDMAACTRVLASVLREEGEIEEEEEFVARPVDLLEYEDDLFEDIAEPLFGDLDDMMREQNAQELTSSKSDRISDVIFSEPLHVASGSDAGKIPENSEEPASEWGAINNWISSEFNTNRRFNKAAPKSPPSVFLGECYRWRRGEVEEEGSDLS